MKRFKILFLVGLSLLILGGGNSVFAGGPKGGYIVVTKGSYNVDTNTLTNNFGNWSTGPYLLNYGVPYLNFGGIVDITSKDLTEITITHDLESSKLSNWVSEPSSYSNKAEESIPSISEFFDYGIRLQMLLNSVNEYLTDDIETTFFDDYGDYAYFDGYKHEMGTGSLLQLYKLGVYTGSILDMNSYFQPLVTKYNSILTNLEEINLKSSTDVYISGEALNNINYILYHLGNPNEKTKINIIADGDMYFSYTRNWDSDPRDTTEYVIGKIEEKAIESLYSYCLKRDENYDCLEYTTPTQGSGTFIFSTTEGHFIYLPDEYTGTIADFFGNTIIASGSQIKHRGKIYTIGENNSVVDEENELKITITETYSTYKATFSQSFTFSEDISKFGFATADTCDSNTEFEFEFEQGNIPTSVVSNKKANGITRCFFAEDLYGNKTYVGGILIDGIKEPYISIEGNKITIDGQFGAFGVPDLVIKNISGNGTITFSGSKLHNSGLLISGDFSDDFTGTTFRKEGNKGNILFIDATDGSDGEVLPNGEGEYKFYASFDNIGDSDSSSSFTLSGGLQNGEIKLGAVTLFDGYIEFDGFSFDPIDAGDYKVDMTGNDDEEENENENENKVVTSLLTLEVGTTEQVTDLLGGHFGTDDLSGFYLGIPVLKSTRAHIGVSAIGAMVDKQEDCNENTSFYLPLFNSNDGLVSHSYTLYGERYLCVKVSDENTTYYTGMPIASMGVKDYYYGKFQKSDGINIYERTNGSRIFAENGATIIGYKKSANDSTHVLTLTGTTNEIDIVLGITALYGSGSTNISSGFTGEAKVVFVDYLQESIYNGAFTGSVLYDENDFVSTINEESGDNNKITTITLSGSTTSSGITINQESDMGHMYFFLKGTIDKDNFAINIGGNTLSLTLASDGDINGAVIEGGNGNENENKNDDDNKNENENNNGNNNSSSSNWGGGGYGDVSGLDLSGSNTSSNSSSSGGSSTNKRSGGGGGGGSSIGSNSTTTNSTTGTNTNTQTTNNSTEQLYTLTNEKKQVDEDIIDMVGLDATMLSNLKTDLKDGKKILNLVEPIKQGKEIALKLKVSANSNNPKLITLENKIDKLLK